VAYCTQADVEIAVGGARILVELLDKDSDGVADAAGVSAILARATAEIDSALQVAIDITTITSTPYPAALIYAAADIAAYYAYLTGTAQQTIPEPMQARYAAALRWLDQVARRERTLGVTPKPASGQQAEQIDRNPAESPQKTPTWSSLAGAFW